MLLDKFPQLKGLVLDMDGVLWHDTEPIGDLKALFGEMDSLGLRYVFATNNATKIAENYVSKLSGFGVEVNPNQIVTSAGATLTYLQSQFPQGSKIFLVGSNSLGQLLASHGFEIVPEDSRQADAVIVGLDTNLTYQKIANAGLIIRSGGAFIATNTDATYPTPSGLFPGAGAMVAAIQCAGGKAPFIIGKPYISMYMQALSQLSLSPSETMGVGDRLETDIAGAQNAGMLSGLVLSGVSRLADAQAWKPAPNIIAKDLYALINN